MAFCGIFYGFWMTIDGVVMAYFMAILWLLLQFIAFLWHCVGFFMALYGVFLALCGILYGRLLWRVMICMTCVWPFRLQGLVRHFVALWLFMSLYGVVRQRVWRPPPRLLPHELFVFSALRCPWVHQSASRSRFRPTSLPRVFHAYIYTSYILNPWLSDEPGIVK